MTYTLKVFLSVLLIHATFMGAGHVYAQDLMPPKSTENAGVEHRFPDLRLTPDKPEIITLDQDIANIIVGNTDHLVVTPDTARRVVLIPRQVGATFLRILAEDGTPLMERHVIIAAPKKKDQYVRIRRACINGEKDCQEYSMYYCPDMCHKLGLVDEGRAKPEQAKQASPSENTPPLEPADGTQTIK